MNSERKKLSGTKKKRNKGDKKSGRGKGILKLKSESKYPDETSKEVVEESADYHSSEEDYTDDGDEGIESYRPGGYHPVSLGDLYNNERYLVVEKLGWGHFSTVWMCKDNRSKASDTGYVALKIQKSASHYREAAFDEIELLTCISNAMTSEVVRGEFEPGFDHCVVQLLDHFEHSGPHGRHVCMVFEMLGENLLSVIKKFQYQGIPIPVVQGFVRQICIGLDFLHRHCSIIHTDLKPENILIAKPPSPPDEEFIRSLLASNHDKQIKRRHRKVGGQKDKSKTKMNDGGGGGHKLETDTKDGTSKYLSSEQRRRLKKKLKKKRQKARKKPTSGRRDCEVSPSVLDAKGQGNRGADGDPEEKLRQSYCETKGEGKESLGKFDSISGSSITALLDQYEEAIERQKMLETAAALDTLTDAHLIGEDDMCAYSVSKEMIRQYNPPSWARTTLVAFLNLEIFSLDDGSVTGDVSPVDERTKAVDDTVVAFLTVRVEDWLPPSDDDIAKLSVVTTPERMLKAFGEPCFHIRQDEVDEDENGYLLWVLELPGTDRDSRRTVCIRGQGVDVENHTYAVAACVLDLSDVPVSDPLHTGTNDDPKLLPVLWSVVLDYRDIDIVVRLFESRLLDLRFVLHCDAPYLFAHEEDAELIFLMKQLCDKPNHRHGACGVAMIGLDTALVTSMLAPPTVSYAVAESKVVNGSTSGSVHGYAGPLDIRKHIRSQRVRLELFHEASIDDALNAYQFMLYRCTQYGQQNRQMHMLGGDSDANLSDDDCNDDASLYLEDNSRQLFSEYLNAKVKLVDVGNACWTHKHFTDDIQTRQYRSPEVILGARYDTSADMWSLACIVFELLTGDLLFDPHAGKSWDRDEDHLAMIVELVGNFPRKVSSVGKYASDYFNRKGELRHILHLKFWSLRDVLYEKYRFPSPVADEIASFLGPLLQVDCDRRASAADCLRHPWLSNVYPSDTDYSTVVLRAQAEDCIAAGEEK